MAGLETGVDELKSRSGNEAAYAIENAPAPVRRSRRSWRGLIERTPSHTLLTPPNDPCRQRPFSYDRPRTSARLSRARPRLRRFSSIPKRYRHPKCQRISPKPLKLLTQLYNVFPTQLPIHPHVVYQYVGNFRSIDRINHERCFYGQTRNLRLRASRHRWILSRSRRALGDHLPVGF